MTRRKPRRHYRQGQHPGDYWRQPKDRKIELAVAHLWDGTTPDESAADLDGLRWIGGQRRG